MSKLDRLARNVADLLDTLERVEGIGASFVATEQDLSTNGAYGRFTVVLLGAIAELERSIMAERQRDAREQLRRDRRHVGRVHYGYETVPHPDGKGLTVRPHPTKGPKLRDAVRNVLAGRSMRSQAQVLGIPPATMRKLLRSPRLIGRVPIAVKVTKTGKDGRLHERTIGWKADPDIPADPEAALITLREWNQLRDMLGRDEPRSWSKTDGYGLALVCHACAGRLYLDTDSGSAGGYRCHRHRGAPTIARGQVDEHVSEWFVSHYANAPVREVVQDTDDSERRERLAAVRLALDEVTEAMRRPGADVLVLAQEVTRLHTERSAIEAEPSRSEIRVIDTGRKMGEQWTEASDAERVVMLRQTAVFVIHPRGREGGRIETVDAVQEPERFAALEAGLPDPIAHLIKPPAPALVPRV